MPHIHDHQGHGSKHYDRAFAIGIALNLGFVLVEGFYGWQVNSLALLADAGHNLSDVAGLILAWGALMASRLHANERHTYGWRKGSILDGDGFARLGVDPAPATPRAHGG